MRERRIGMVQWIVVALVSVSCALVSVMTWGTAKGRSGPQTPAELWLSWSSESRTTYVRGYLHGFTEGKRAGCSYYQDKIIAYLPNEPIPIEKSPKLACLNDLPDFTAPYFQVYVDAVTNYYTKYSRDPKVGTPLILFYLASPPGLTIDQIHAKLTGEVGPER